MTHQLKKATDRDNSLQHFKSVIMNGWQNDKQDLLAELILYHSFCDKMSVQGGPTLKGEWVIVPFSMRPEIKTAIHSSQSGIYSCLKKARECLLARHDWGHGAVYLHL